VKHAMTKPCEWVFGSDPRSQSVSALDFTIGFFSYWRAKNQVRGIYQIGLLDNVVCSLETNFVESKLLPSLGSELQLRPPLSCVLRCH
jgi:hypothetical protein